MRVTFGDWRRTSTAPMKISQRIPNSAHAVAVATPCWPAPVSAMTRVLPVRRASSTWPKVLLILWAPVWQRSSRFRYTRAPPQFRVMRFASLSGVGRPAKSRNSASSSARKPGSTRALQPGPLQLVEGRHERLGDETATVGAEPPRAVTAQSAFHVTPRAAAMNAAMAS